MSSHAAQSLSEDEQEVSNLQTTIDANRELTEGATGAGNEVLKIHLNQSWSLFMLGFQPFEMLFINNLDLIFQDCCKTVKQARRKEMHQSMYLPFRLCFFA